MCYTCYVYNNNKWVDIMHHLFPQKNKRNYVRSVRRDFPALHPCGDTPRLIYRMLHAIAVLSVTTSRTGRMPCYVTNGKYTVWRNTQMCSSFFLCFKVTVRSDNWWNNFSVYLYSNFSLYINIYIKIDFWLIFVDFLFALNIIHS